MPLGFVFVTMFCIFLLRITHLHTTILPICRAMYSIIRDHVLYEIKGDAENLLGLKEEAKLSYLQAITSAQSQAIQALLRMKLADLEIKE